MVGNSSEQARLDVRFDFQSEVAQGRDPDSWSPTLIQYHELLWSKPLPDGTPVEVAQAGRPGGFHLRFAAPSGLFLLTSDSITHRYAFAPVVRQIPARDLPNDGGYTIASALVFPGLQIDSKQTINQARGMNPRVKDRFDLTLECIRRHYASKSSPLTAVMDRYSDFFQLFGSFVGYVDFFLLQDLVPDGREISFLHPFDDFTSSPVPTDVDGYLAYRARTKAFIDARTARIEACDLAS